MSNSSLVCSMAVTSAASAELIAVSSILCVSFNSCEYESTYLLFSSAHMSMFPSPLTKFNSFV